MKKLYYFLIALCLIVFFRENLFNAFFSYKIIGERKVVKIENQELKAFLNDNEDNEMKNLIKMTLSKTAEKLNFTFYKCDENPNLLFGTKKANCIGYSAFFASSLQYVLEKKKINKDWKISHEIGKIYFLNENIHQYFNSPFFKDHDFVVVENMKTKETFVVDSSLYDYFRINFVKLKNV